jgi:uncharacterized protein YutE (UPF0331/DUF86 family)
LIILLYSPWFLLEGLSIALRESRSEKTLSEPKLGIIISNLTKLHDSIDEYLKLSITDPLTNSDRLPDSDGLYESLQLHLLPLLLNSKGDTEKNQLNFIENEKDIHSLELIEIYIEPLFYVKDHCLQKFIVQRALQVIGECLTDNGQRINENRETEIVLFNETKSIFIEKSGVQKESLVGLRNLLCHTKNCKTLLARTIIEGNNAYFRSVVYDFKYDKKSFSDICKEREQLFHRAGDALKCGKYLVSEIRNQIHKRPTKNTTSNNTIKATPTNNTNKATPTNSTSNNTNKATPINNTSNNTNKATPTNNTTSNDTNKATPTKNTTYNNTNKATPTNNTNKLGAINDLWQTMKNFSKSIKMNKKKHENLLVFFIECRLQELQKVSNSLNTDKDAGKLKAMEFFYVRFMGCYERDAF